MKNVNIETKDEHHCFKCQRDLGPQLEWKKMDTDAGPICYVCFNRQEEVSPPPELEP